MRPGGVDVPDFLVRNLIPLIAAALDERLAGGDSGDTFEVSAEGAPLGSI